MDESKTSSAEMALTGEPLPLAVPASDDPLPALHTFYTRVASAVAPGTPGAHQMSLIIDALHDFENATGRPLTPARAPAAAVPAEDSVGTAVKSAG